MQNPLNATSTYRVGSEIYRRNCPLEAMRIGNPAVAAEFSGGEEEEADRTEHSDSELAQRTESASPSPSCSHSSSCAVLVIETSKIVSDGLASTEADAGSQSTVLSLQTRTVSVVNREDGLIYTVRQPDSTQLVGTVKWDAKERLYHDSMKIVSALIGMLRGKDGHKQKKLEEINGCSIHFPKKRSARTETEIRITSHVSAHHVQACGQALHKAVADARKQTQPTHFVSVPIFDGRLREQYTELVQLICKDEQLPKECRNEQIFMTPAKLHLTLSVLKLFTEQEVQKVRAFLDAQFKSDKIREILAGQDRIRVEMPALEHFTNKQPDRVSVVFARAESEKLQRLANALDDALCEAELAEKRKTNDVVLHMTVLNTKYLWEKRRVFLNAVPLLERYGQLPFEPVDLQEVHLCEMRGNDSDELNGYKSVHCIRFP